MAFDRDRSGGNTMAVYRDRCSTAIAADSRHRPEGVVGVCADVRNLHDISFEYRARRHAPPTWRFGIGAPVDLKHLGGEAAVRYEVQELAVEPVDKAELGLAESLRALGDHVEHRLDVARRTTDDP